VEPGHEVAELRNFIFILLLMVALFYFERFKYDDCKKVGHSTLYCVLKLGN